MGTPARRIVARSLACALAGSIVVLDAARAVQGLGALVPAQAALGHGDPQAFVDGLRNALIVGAGLSALGAVGTAILLRTRPRRVAEQPAELALEQA